MIGEFVSLNPNTGSIILAIDTNLTELRDS